MASYEGARSCPRCSMGLTRGSASDVVVLACGRCGGVWLDGAASIRVMAMLDREMVEAAAGADQRAEVASVDTAGKAPCPVCAQSMVQTTSPGTSIVIDTCAPHGTWFDRSELVAITRAIAGQRAAEMPDVPPPVEAVVGDGTTGSRSFNMRGGVGEEVALQVGSALIEGAFSLIAGLLG